MTAEDSKNYIVTFGCRLNAFESEAIKQAVNEARVENLAIFNSCAVTEKSERDLRAAIRKMRRENPNQKIILTGCAAQINPEKYAKMPEIDLIIGNADKSKPESYDFAKNSSIFLSSNNHKNSKQNLQKKIQERANLNQGKDEKTSSISSKNQHQDQLFIASKQKDKLALTLDETSKIKVNSIMSVRDTAPQLVSYFENQTRAFLEIQNGCNHRCTFCIIPYGRGNSRSVPFGEIVNQTRKLVQAGHQEIVLTGVDISDYGLDLPGSPNLSQMIKRLLKLVPKLPRLRLSSVDVAELKDDFFEVLSDEPRFMPYLHLSVQSGDDLILKRMARRHNRQQILDFCSKARKIRPEITFGADIIAGFPTESDEMFNNSLTLISEADLIFTHIFPYSKRTGTPAANMPQIDGKIIKERAKKLREAGEKQLELYLRKQIGKEFLVLFEKNNKGKTENFLDVKLLDSTDCQTNQSKILKVFINNQQNKILTGAFSNLI